MFSKATMRENYRTFGFFPVQGILSDAEISSEWHLTTYTYAYNIINPVCKPGLTFKGSTYCPHRVLYVFLWTSEKKKSD
jgi:hypothetical protein